MYEKVKFLQSYPTTVSLQMVISLEYLDVNLFLPLQSEVRHGDDAMRRYATEYEERMDPFSAFSKRVCNALVLKVLSLTS